jgi:hypothetical protein
MYDEEAGTYVCQQDQLVRHVPVASVPAPLAVDLPVRIHGVVSSPGQLNALDVDKEKELLERALARPVGEGLAQMYWAPSATWNDLHDQLMDGPWHMLHFIGHSGFDAAQDERVLALVGRGGHADIVTAHRFTGLLRQARPMPRLIVLKSCSGAQTGATDLFSGTGAALVRAGVSAVAAMQFAIMLGRVAGPSDWGELDLVERSSERRKWLGSTQQRIFWRNLTRPWPPLSSLGYVSCGNPSGSPPPTLRRPVSSSMPKHAQTATYGVVILHEQPTRQPTCS